MVPNPIPRGDSRRPLIRLVMTQGLLQLSLFGRDQMVRGHPTQFTEVIRADLELNRAAGELVSSVVIRSEQLHRFQRLSDPWQRQTSGQNQELFAQSVFKNDQRSRVNMALSTPGAPAVIGLTRLYCNQGERFLLTLNDSSSMFLTRAEDCSTTAGRSKSSGNTGLKQDSVSGRRPDWEWLVG